MMSFGPASCDLDLDSPGRRAGFINLPHSDNELAFSSVQVPLGVIVGGAGPTVLLTAGSHGDEYEGQVILHRLMQETAPERLQGRMILMPALNAPAVTARSRVSPLDGGNMNRAFPGGTARGPTAAIAGFVAQHLLPRADAVIDFHSGGTCTRYLECGFLCIGPDAALNARNLVLAEVFGAPFTMISRIDGTGGDFDTTAHLQGVPFLSCELGGMGGFSPDAFTLGWQGALRILHHLGCLAAPEVPPALPTRFIEAGSPFGHVTAAHHGLAQIHVRLGQRVGKGDPVATIFDTHGFGETPHVLTARQDGIVSILRRNPMVRPGDHLCFVSREIARSELAKPTPTPRRD